MQSFDWNATIQVIRERVPQTQFQNWIKPVSFLRKNEKVLVLGVPSRFHEEWVRNHYSHHFTSAIQQQCGSELQLEFEVISQQEAPDPVEVLTPSTVQPIAPSQQILKTSPTQNQPEPVRPQLRLVNSSLANPFPTSNPMVASPMPSSPVPEEAERALLPNFSQPFFSSPYNHVGYQCAQLFAESDIFPMNTLVICGAVGMGKSHLLVDMGQRLQARRPDLKVRYTHAEAFTDEWVRALKSNDLSTFHQKYRRDTDCLLFDNIHGLSKRYKTQEALLHLFNEILQRGGRVAFTSEEPIARLSEFIEPLKSRMLSAIFAEIKPPCMEDKVNLLQQVAAHHRIAVDPLFIRTLVNHGQKDVRELVASLLRFHLQATIENTQLDNRFLSKQGVLVQTATQSASIDEIIGLVEHTFGVPRTELYSKSRKGSTTWARQVAMYLARTYTLLPLQEIGKSFGRDHATVIHAFQKVSEAMKTQPTKKYEVDYLKQKLENRSTPK